MTIIKKKIFVLSDQFSTEQETCRLIVRNKKYPSWIFWKKRRYVLAVLAFFASFNIYTLRANLSIAIIAMTKNRSIILENNTVVYGPEFDWDSKTQGYVLSSFFFGYVTTQIPGGWLADKVGGKHLLGGGIAITGILTLLTPWLANVNVYALIFLRILEGVFEGVTYPSMSSILARWSPPLEKSKLSAIAYSGNTLGTVVAMLGSAYLAETSGWPSIFYNFGALSIVWYIIWWIFATNSPNNDPRITREELHYIEKTQGNSGVKRNIKHPWKQILRSPAVWAIITANFAADWGLYTLLTQLPTFMKDMFNYDLGKNGTLSALPYLAMTVMMVFAGQLADWLRQKKIFTTTQVRKILTCTSFIINAIFIVATVFSTSPSATTVFLVLASGVGSFTAGGFGVNYLDIAPQHAGVLLGIANSISTLAGIISPIATGYIVKNHNPKEWQVVFCISSGIYVAGSLIYGIFASGEVQPWAVVTSSDEHRVEETEI